MRWFIASVLNSGTSPGRGHCVVSLGKTLYSHSALSTQVYKWIPANLMLGANQGGVKIFIVASS